jgi:hypothetical protein
LGDIKRSECLRNRSREFGIVKCIEKCIVRHDIGSFIKQQGTVYYVSPASCVMPAR